jgi:hypothetical protein
MATTLCPAPAGAFMGVLERGGAASAGDEEAAFDAMAKCVVARMSAARARSGGGKALQ